MNPLYPVRNQSETAQVVYIYSRSRMAYRTPGFDLPDTPLYGLNHLPDFQIEAKSVDITEVRIPAVVRKHADFRLLHCLLYFTARRYPVVFGPSLVYQLPLKRLLSTRTRFILLNININQILFKYERTRLLYRLVRRVILQADGIVCLSHYQAEELSRRHRIPEALMTFVPFGVDTGYHSYFPTIGRQDYVLSVGKDKGRDYATLFSVAALNPKIRFVVVCSHRNLQGLSAAPGNVDIRYEVCPDLLRELYRSARLLILPTVSDNSGAGMDCSGQTVLLDAMASGLPVIATDKAYLSDYASPNREIVVVPPADPHALTDALRWLLSDGRARARLAAAARARTEREFTTYGMAEKLANYFSRFL